jgi:hypothetical protein
MKNGKQRKETQKTSQITQKDQMTGFDLFYILDFGILLGNEVLFF